MFYQKNYIKKKVFVLLYKEDVCLFVRCYFPPFSLSFQLKFNSLLCAKDAFN